jgi:hypothetical protein
MIIMTTYNRSRRTLFFSLAALVLTLGTTPILLLQQQSAYAWIDPNPNPRSQKAPIATSGDNVYLVWWTDKGTPNKNGEVMFRASTNNGQTFGDKINLSNSSKTDSVDAMIDTSGDRVFVTWWERNATSNEPLLRTSTDKGATFGPIMKLGANETIGSSAGG